jgi:hypothetical protein
MRRSDGCREGDEERVSLRVHLDPAVRGERGSQQAAMVGQRIGVRSRSEGVQEPRRALDVGEEERDRASGQIRPHAAEL